MSNLPSRRLLAFLALLAPFLTTCGTSDAASIEAQPDANEAASIPSRATEEDAQVRAVTEYHPESPRCPYDGMKLIVLQGAREITGRDYCSAYGIGDARAVRDARGDHYILLNHAEGHGTGATVGYLTVYRLDDVYLDERARLLSWSSAGPGASSDYDFQISTPPGGGIVIRGPWTITGQSRRSLQPVRNRTVLEIDTRPGARL